MGIARNIARLIPNGSGVLSDANAPSGSVIQVVSAISTTVTSIGTESDGPLVSLNITPISANSKILLIGSFSMGWVSSSPNVSMHFGRTIGGTTTYPGRFMDGNRVGGVSGGQVTGMNEDMVPFAGHFYDSPETTSQITYQLRYAVYDGAVIAGRVSSTSDAVWATRTSHNLLAMEIAN